MDRGQWLDTLLKDGDWRQIRALRKPKRPTCGRLRNANGQLVESDEWAETMADHLERVQWHVRPACLVDGPALGPELQVELGSFTETEAGATVAQLKKNLVRMTYPQNSGRQLH